MALDARAGALGVGVATCHPAVGALVPYARAGVGGVATQASTNPLYGPQALDLLAAGEGPDEAVRRLTAADRGRDHRQLHVVDAAGRAAAWTGAETVPWAGHRAGDGVSAAGNMLTGAAVVEALLQGYAEAAAAPLAARLLAALEAGEAAGGDKRGRMSAALFVVADDAPALDLRVDLAEDPLAALRRLLAACDAPDVRRFRAALPSSGDPGRSIADVPGGFEGDNA